MIFIEKGLDPDERLEILLQAEFRTKAESALEDLYTVALQNSGLWEGKSFANDFRAFLGIILVSKEPLLHSTIDGLLGRDARKSCGRTIQPFGCVLRWVTPEPVHILHHPSPIFFPIERGARRTFGPLPHPPPHSSIPSNSEIRPQIQHLSFGYVSR
jgi:hypothetical protein